MRSCSQFCRRGFHGWVDNSQLGFEISKGLLLRLQVRCSMQSSAAPGIPSSTGTFLPNQLQFIACLCTCGECPEAHMRFGSFAHGLADVSQRLHGLAHMGQKLEDIRGPHSNRRAFACGAAMTGCYHVVLRHLASRQHVLCTVAALEMKGPKWPKCNNEPTHLASHFPPACTFCFFRRSCDVTLNASIRFHGRRIAAPQAEFLSATL